MGSVVGVRTGSVLARNDGGTIDVRSGDAVRATSRNSRPERLAGALDHLKPAVFGALTATMLVTHEGVGPEHLAAVAVAFALARRGLDLTLAILAGMVLVTVAGLIA